MEFLNSIPLIGPVLFWVLPFLIVLSIVVAIHELGHLMVGRWCGIKAEVFSVGFGKPIWQRTDKQGTVWQVALLPLGGYVKFLGDMDPASAGQVDDSDLAPEDRGRAFHNAALWRRALTVLAGPVANFILSIVIIFGLVMHLGVQSNDPVIASVGDLRAEEIGFKAGDRVLKVGDKNIEKFHEIVSALGRTDGAPTAVVVEREGARVDLVVRYSEPAVIVGLTPEGAALAAGLRPEDKIRGIDGVPIRSARQLQVIMARIEPEKELTFSIERGDELLDFTFTPDVVTRAHPETGEETPIPTMGISLAVLSGIVPHRVSASAGQALEVAFARVWETISGTVTYIGRMIFDGATTEHLSGPIGIAKHSTKAAESGILDLIGFIALVSTAIGFLNLLPIPILDGGHLVFYLIEAVRGRPTHEAIVRYGSVVGLSLLLLLMVFVTFNNDLGLGAWLAEQ